ncbi:MAG: hypothetical protein WBA57_14280 [Elainellaceae cyanobacterium]
MSQQQPHYRLTVGDLRQLYDSCLIPAPAYLYLYLKVTRKDGWRLRVKNVSQFCKEIGMKRSTFYKAKAKLIDAGLICEEIIGSLDLWVSPLETGVTFGDSVSHMLDTESRMLDTESHMRDTHPPQKQSEQESCNSTDLSQISYRSFSLAHPPPTEREPVENLTDPQNEAFREWLREKARKLPNPPQFLETWVEKQASKESFQREFLLIRKGSEKANVPRVPPNRFQVESACEQAYHAGDRPYLRSRLQQLWHEGHTELIDGLCHEHPEWRFCVTCSGVQEVDDGDG